jgi:ABC-type bacteriocin/lantibiotic exporter with double-glycine peptidase domain
LFFAVLAAALAGCAGMSFNDLRAGIELRGHNIDGVPFVRQGEGDCGPAALVSVLSFYGRAVDIGTVRQAVYTPKLKGTLPMDMESYARSAGFGAGSGPGSLGALRTAVRRDRPVICLLDLGFGPWRRPHYVTVIGFDDVNKALIMHDGRTPHRVARYDSFDASWGRTGRWMLVVEPEKD